jgi:hypothetical protein
MRITSHRPALAGLLVLLLTALLTLEGASAREIETAEVQAQAGAPSYGPIASTALKYLGTHGGQCWEFARAVVKEATGRTIGFDYRQGYFEAGAIEVSAAEARDGDLIQLARDSDTSPDADYPGLHTAIILENLGNGRFNAIDSNQNWDEMVGLRPGYAPYEIARLYPGLAVHIYRIPGGPGNAAAPAPLQPGDRARVNTPGDVLNLRSAPGLGAPISARLQDGLEVTIVGGPEESGGYRWLQVNTPSGTGWVADAYLVRVTTAANSPAPFRLFVPMATARSTFAP